MDAAGLELVRWQDWVGNACYLMLAASYFVINIYWLRILAIVASSIEGVYFYYAAETPLWVGIGWNVIFVTINIVHLTFLYRERWQVRFSEQERMLHQGLFAEFGPAEFKRLIKNGLFRDVYEGTALTMEGRLVQELHVLIKGMAKVEVAGETIALLQPGSFVGEMSLLTREPASATVTTLVECRVFSIQQETLMNLLERDPATKSAIHRVIGRDLVVKLKSRWELIA
jgi:Cyclic nucleotide-binding domain